MSGARSKRGLFRSAIALCAIAASCASAARAWGQAAEAGAAAPTRAVVDRVAVRFYAPETGGSSRPRFITERMLALEARFEALSDENLASAAYQERYLRAAMERHVAEEILATLLVEQGTEPVDLPHQVDEWRAELVQRIGGVEALRAAEQAEGIDDGELEALLRRRVRAAFFVDRAVTPILSPSDEQLREIYRTTTHPFKGLKFEDARAALARWYVGERLRVVETSFLQAARTRVKIVVVPK